MSVLKVLLKARNSGICPGIEPGKRQAWLNLSVSSQDMKERLHLVQVSPSVCLSVRLFDIIVPVYLSSNFLYISIKTNYFELIPK